MFDNHKKILIIIACMFFHLVTFGMNVEITNLNKINNTDGFKNIFLCDSAFEVDILIRAVQC